MRHRERGFSLVELIVVVGIIGILAMIGLSGFDSYMVRATRAAAQSYMSTVASKQEEYVLRHGSYATAANSDTADLGLVRPTDVTTFYAMSIAPITNVSGVDIGFSISAVPIAGTRQASDGTLTLDHRGVKAPSEKW